MEFLSPPVAVKAIFFDVNGFVSCDARVTLSFIDLRLLQVPTGISRFYSGEYSQCSVSGSATRRVDFVPMHASNIRLPRRFCSGQSNDRLFGVFGPKSFRVVEPFAWNPIERLAISTCAPRCRSFGSRPL